VSMQHVLLQTLVIVLEITEEQKQIVLLHNVEVVVHQQPLELVRMYLQLVVVQEEVHSKVLVIIVEQEIIVEVVALEQAMIHVLTILLQ
jgi:hypothetical protein